MILFQHCNCMLRTQIREAFVMTEVEATFHVWRFVFMLVWMVSASVHDYTIMLWLPDRCQPGNVADRLESACAERWEWNCSHWDRAFLSHCIFPIKSNSKSCWSLEKQSVIPVLTVSITIVTYTHCNIGQSHFMAKEKAVALSNELDNANHHILTSDLRNSH